MSEQFLNGTSAHNRPFQWCCLRDPTFSRFSRTPTCDGRTDRHRAMTSTADA